MRALKNFGFVSVVTVAAIQLTGCMPLLDPFSSSGDNDNPQDHEQSCTTATDTAINGIENDYSVTLNQAGDWNSNIHLVTAGHLEGSYNHVLWSSLNNRQTCSSNGLSESDSFGGAIQSYIDISQSPTVFYMQVNPGKNYIDYKAYGCQTSDDSTCTELIETGTIVLTITDGN